MYKRLLAGILAACLLVGNAAIVSAAEPDSEENAFASEEDLDSAADNEEQDEYDLNSEDGQTQGEPGSESEAPLANSWRYINGERIESDGPVVQPEEGEIEAREGRRFRRGIDVSQWQGMIDWEKVKASGIEFAIIRCGFSVDKEKYDDKYWRRNVSECERLGIPYGVYLYSYAQDTEWALSEAEHVLRLDPRCLFFFRL